MKNCMWLFITLPNSCCLFVTCSNSDPHKKYGSYPISFTQSKLVSMSIYESHWLKESLKLYNFKAFLLGKESKNNKKQTSITFFRDAIFILVTSTFEWSTFLHCWFKSSKISGSKTLVTIYMKYIWLVHIVHVCSNAAYFAKTFGKLKRNAIYRQVRHNAFLW